MQNLFLGFFSITFPKKGKKNLKSISLSCSLSQNLFRFPKCVLRVTVFHPSLTLNTFFFISPLYFSFVSIDFLIINISPIWCFLLHQGEFYPNEKQKQKQKRKGKKSFVSTIVLWWKKVSQPSYIGFAAHFVWSFVLLLLLNFSSENMSFFHNKFYR